MQFPEVEQNCLTCHSCSFLIDQGRTEQSLYANDTVLKTPYLVDLVGHDTATYCNIVFLSTVSKPIS